MGLMKRGGLYWFEFWAAGKRYLKSAGVGNQQAAGQIECAFRTALAKGDVGITERKVVPSFRAAMTDFLLWSAQSHKEPTHARYITSSVALLKHFRDTSLDKATPEEGKRVKTTKRLRPATVNRELACLKALFNLVIKADILAKNPVSRVKMLCENNLQTRVLSFTEQHAYLAKATPVLRDVATLILETGMRPEEVYKAQPENVNLVKGYLQVQHGKTAAARRRLCLTALAARYLRDGVTR